MGQSAPAQVQKILKNLSLASSFFRAFRLSKMREQTTAQGSERNFALIFPKSGAQQNEIKMQRKRHKNNQPEWNETRSLSPKILHVKKKCEKVKQKTQPTQMRNEQKSRSKNIKKSRS